MPLVGGFHVLFGPGAAGLVVLAMMAVSRWTFGARRRRRPSRRQTDYGLLVAVATYPTVQAAATAVATLAENGVRGTVAPAPSGPDVRVSADGYATRLPAGGTAVLVFGEEEERARRLLAPRHEHP